MGLNARERLDLIQSLVINTKAKDRPVNADKGSFEKKTVHKRHANVARTFSHILGRKLNEGDYVFIDNTLLGSGKKGYIFTDDCFARSEASMEWTIDKKLRLRDPVYLDHLSKVVRRENNLIFYFKDGHKEEAFFNIYAEYFNKIFKGILNAINAEENDADEISDEELLAREQRMQEESEEIDRRLQELMENASPEEREEMIAMMEEAEAEEESTADAEAERLAEEERRKEERLAEEKRMQEVREEMEARLAEEKRKEEEARAAAAEQKRLEEEARLVEEQRRKEEAQRVLEARLAEEKRKEEEVRAAAAEQKRLAEEQSRKEAEQQDAVTAGAEEQLALRLRDFRSAFAKYEKLQEEYNQAQKQAEQMQKEAEEAERIASQLRKKADEAVVHFDGLRKILSEAEAETSRLQKACAEADAHLAAERKKQDKASHLAEEKRKAEEAAAKSAVKEQAPVSEAEKERLRTENARKLKQKYPELLNDTSYKGVRHSIAVIGTEGSGKTTFCAAVAALVNDRYREEGSQLYDMLRYNHMDLQYGINGVCMDIANLSLMDGESSLDIVKNCLCANRTAEAMIVMVSLDTGVNAELEGQLKAARSCGIREAFLFVNKCDLANEQEDVDRVVREAVRILAKYGYTDPPILTGWALDVLENGRASYCAEMTVKMLEELTGRIEQARPKEQQPVMIRTEKLSTKEPGVAAVTGTVLRGTLKRGDGLNLVGYPETDTVLRVGWIDTQDHRDAASAAVGEKVTISFVNLPQMPFPTDHFRSGQVLAAEGSIKAHSRFSAMLYVLTGDEGSVDEPVCSGWEGEFEVGGDYQYGSVLLAPNEETILPGCYGEVLIELGKPIALEAGQSFTVMSFDVETALGRVTAVF